MQREVRLEDIAGWKPNRSPDWFRIGASVRFRLRDGRPSASSPPTAGGEPLARTLKQHLTTPL